MIVFNKPHITGKEIVYIQEVINASELVGNGSFTQACHHFFEKNFGFQKALLTPSGTASLEMAALLADVQPGDEVIMPSFTFSSTANAFLLRGAKIIFADSQPRHPNLDTTLLEELVTPRTKVIVPVHYAGMACNMDDIMALAKKYGLFVVEDAAQAITTRYKDKLLGSFGDFSAFSFHQTKNIGAGEAGMLVINNPAFNERAEIIREKGTDRSAFYRGEVAKYYWRDIGSSYLPAEIVAAFLMAQLENMALIQEKRLHIWNHYLSQLSVLAERVQLPVLPENSTNNAHIFYLVCASLDERTRLMGFLRKEGIETAFHYQALHASPFYKELYDHRPLPYAEKYADCLLRLPLHTSLSEAEVDSVSQAVLRFYE